MNDRTLCNKMHKQLVCSTRSIYGDVIGCCKDRMTGHLLQCPVMFHLYHLCALEPKRARQHINVPSLKALLLAFGASLPHAKEQQV